MRRDLVVVGASAGGVEARRLLVAALPKDLPAAVVVVLHMPAGGTSALPAILDRSGPLPAQAAEDGVELRNAHIYVARPDHHVIVQDGVLGRSRGPTENGHRPAVIGVIPSGARHSRAGPGGRRPPRPAGEPPAARPGGPRASLAHRMVDVSRGAGRGLVADRYVRQEEEALAAADILRRHLLRGGVREETGT